MSFAMALRFFPFLAVATSSSCDEGSLLQTGEMQHRALSLSESMSFHSPEFQRLLPEMDATFTPIEGAKMPTDMCLRMMEALQKPHIVMKNKALIHTGIVVPEGPSKFDTWVDVARKLRLLPMSFLATQNLKNSKLIFWANVDPSHHLLQEIFTPLLEKYSDSIEVRKFDAELEMGKVAATYNPENATVLKNTLLDIFHGQREVTSQSDLMRTMLLFNYGGAWMDSDVILVNDLSPLLEEDWGVLFQGGFVNQGTLSVSKPASPFISAWMAHILDLGLAKGWSAYGPAMVTKMLKEIQRSMAERTFHVLPRCFFEGGIEARQFFEPYHQWPSGWATFFDKKLDSKEEQLQKLNYVDPASDRHLAFGFHWHNSWDHPIMENSLSHLVEKMYCEKLGVTL